MKQELKCWFLVMNLKSTSGFLNSQDNNFLVSTIIRNRQSLSVTNLKTKLPWKLQYLNLIKQH